MNLRALSSFVLLLISLPAHAEGELQLHVQPKICQNLILNNALMDSQEERVALLARIFSNDFNLLHSKKFLELATRSIVTGLHNHRFPEYAEIAKHDQFMNPFSVARQYVLRDLNDLSVPGPHRENLLSQMSAYMWNIVASDFYSTYPSQVVSEYPVSKNEYADTRSLVLYINDNEELKKATRTLFEAMIVEVLPVLRSYEGLVASKYRMSKWMLPYVNLLPPLSYGYYCFIGHCTKYAATKSISTHLAVKRIISGTQIKKPMSEAFLLSQKQNGIEISTEKLETEFKSLPDKALLDDYLKAPQYEMPMVTAVHRLNLLSVGDRDRFVQNSFWDDLTKSMKKNPTEAERLIAFDALKNHTDKYQERLRLQLWLATLALETLEKMNPAVLSRIKSDEEIQKNPLTPTQILHQNTLKKLMIDLNAHQTEIEQMIVTLHKMIENFEKVDKLVHSYQVKISPLAANQESNEVSLEEIDRNIKSLVKELRGK